MDQIAPDMSMRSLRERAARFGGANTIRNVIAEDERAGEVIHRLRGMMKKGEVKHEPIDMNDLITSTLRLLHSELIDRRICRQRSATPCNSSKHCSIFW